LTPAQISKKSKIYLKNSCKPREKGSTAQHFMILYPDMPQVTITL